MTYTSTTARDLIRRAMLLAGVLGQGENPSASEANDGLRTLNEMVESWAAERLMVYAVTNVTLPLVPSQQVYTWGPGGDLTTNRPVQKLRGAWLNLTQSTNPVSSIPLTMVDPSQWLNISVLSTTSSYPIYLWWNPEYPQGKLHFWPVPLEANTVTIAALTGFMDGIATLDTVIDLPPGYSKALTYGLAVEVAALFGRQAPESIVAAAVGAKAKLKSTNAPIDYVTLDPGVLYNPSRTWNWRTGE